MSKHHAKTSKQWRSNYKTMIDEMIAEERQKEREQMPNIEFENVKIRATHLDSGFNCEFDMTSVTTEQVKHAVLYLKEQGFIKTSMGTPKQDNSGKTGTVVSVVKKEGKDNQWTATVNLIPAGSGQQVLTTFAATALRKGDHVRLAKNDKGYVEAVVINDEDMDGRTQDDIPF